MQAYMKFVFFRFRKTEKMDSVTKGLMGAMPPQNFGARTALWIQRITFASETNAVDTHTA